MINAAQASLVAEQASYPNSQNVMILLSDGDATATCSVSVAGICTLGPMPGASTTVGERTMSTIQECHQAITAAQAAGSGNPGLRRCLWGGGVGMPD